MESYSDHRNKLGSEARHWLNFFSSVFQVIIISEAQKKTFTNHKMKIVTTMLNHC